MAWFGKKDEKPPVGKTGEPGDPVQTEGPLQFSPEKAAKFFQHARSMHDATNYEYAMVCWLRGLRLDPANMTGLEGFFQSVPGFLSDPASKKGPGKEVQNAVSGKTDVDRYLSAMLEWSVKPTEASLAVRATELAVKLNLSEPALWMGDRALAAVLREKRVRKDLLMKLSDSFNKVGSFDKAVTAAEQAYKVDPSDGQLGAHIRGLAAQATMNSGGYDQTGEQGGYRKNVRNAEKQQLLDDADRIGKTDETIDRLIGAARQEVQNRPGDIPSLEKLAKLLMERGRREDEEMAHALYTKAAVEFKQFRFRELAGDVRIRQARRGVSELRRMAEQAPGDEDVGRMFAQATADMNRLEADEYKLRVEAYPSDLSRKLELGKRLFAINDWDGAIGLLQEAQGDPKGRTVALTFLGQAFLKIEYVDEAIETFRKALESRELTPELQLELRYFLMAALQAKAETARDLATGEDAERIAASIAAQQFGYKDIRARRDAIKKLVAELRAK